MPKKKQKGKRETIDNFTGMESVLEDDQQYSYTSLVSNPAFKIIKK